MDHRVGSKPGDRVIVDGIMKIRPGAPVTIAAAQTAPGRPPAAPKSGAARQASAGEARC